MKKKYGFKAKNHITHIAFTYERLMALLLVEGKDGEAWIKTRDLAVDGINNEKMVLTHLLWLQSKGAIIIKDIEPFAGAVRVVRKI